MQLPRAAVRVVDLSVTLSEELPAAWPGHMPFAHPTWNWYAPLQAATGPVRCDGPYRTNFLVLDEHTGTHVDGPTHFIPPPDSGLPWAGPLGDQSTEHLDLEQMCGPAVVVDVRHLVGSGGAGRSPFIEPAHLAGFEREHGAFAPGEVVLFHSDWDRWYVEGPGSEPFLTGPLVRQSSPGWPAPSPAAMLLLHARGVRAVGTDGPSMGAVHDGAPVHQEGLSRGMLFVEMLTGLGQLPPRGAYFLFLPLKLAGGTGGPGRAVALLAVDD